MKRFYILGPAIVMIGLAAAAHATATQSVTSKTSTVNPDGSVSYQSHTVVTKKPQLTSTVLPDRLPLVTFYYFDPRVQRIMASDDLTNDILDIWDDNKNRSIDNHEFYLNKMVVYEPTEFSKRTYQDIDGNGLAELTQEEYTMRLQQLPAYSNLNADGEEGLNLYEFSGVGFQDSDIDNNNQVSYDEIRAAFYHQKGLAPRPLKINR